MIAKTKMEVVKEPKEPAPTTAPEQVKPSPAIVQKTEAEIEFQATCLDQRGMDKKWVIYLTQE